MKVDLVMWTYNGAKTLGVVLDRINNVIPKECVNQRFIVDDYSSDCTRKIAEEKGWNVIFNEGCGICDGANTALKHVETDYFCSFEQDLLLSCLWWKHVVPNVLCDDVAAASGIRHQYPCVCMSKLHEYTAERYVKWKSGLPVYLNTEGRIKSAMSWGHTLDNTIYNTKVLRELGGFPRLETHGGSDTVLTFLYVKAGYEWHVNFNVVSMHLNKTFWNEMHCHYNYGTCYDEISKHVPNLPTNLFSQVLRFIYSPFSALHPMIVKRCPELLFAYPMLRFYSLKGLLDSRKGKKWCGH